MKERKMSATSLILKNATVITMDSRRPTAQLIAIAGEKISFVGDNSAMDSCKGPGTKVIDCHGKAIVPGFNDAHAHIFSFLRKQLSVDLSPESVRSIAEIKTAIRRRAETVPPGQWIMGTDYNEFFLAEKRPPNRWEIDEVAPEHPVILCHFSGHPCVLNSKGLALAGITRDTPDLPAMPIIRDPATGEATGLLPERNLHIQEHVMPPLTDEEWAQAAAMANEHYLSRGLTSLQEASVTNGINQWHMLERFKEDDKLKSRVYMMAGMEQLDEFIESGKKTGFGDDRLRLGSAKMYMLNDPQGNPFPPQEVLNGIVLKAHRAGFQLGIHALQVNAIDATIAAFEYAQKQSRRADPRHRIEHCSPLPPASQGRLKALGAVAVMQPTWIYYSGDRFLVQRTAEQLTWLTPLRSVLDAGVRVAASSDCPVVPDDPLVGMCACVTRCTRAGQQIRPDQRVSATEALSLYTTNAAYASFEDNIKGSVTPGKLADLVVLSDDPTAVPPERIKDIKVETTIIGGEVVWQA